MTPSRITILGRCGFKRDRYRWRWTTSSRRWNWMRKMTCSIRTWVVWWFWSARWGETVNNYKQAVKLKTQFDHAHYMLGNALLLMDRVSEAREQYEWVLRINPDHPQARSRLSQLRAR